VNRVRFVIAIALIALLGAVVAFMSPRSAGTSTTEAKAVTTTLAAPVSTTPATPALAAPSTTTLEQRTAEVEAILEELYFGWLAAVYRNDEQAVRKVVATEDYVDTFEGAVRRVEFTKEPSPNDISVTIDAILLDRLDCLVVHSMIDTGDLLVGSETFAVVDVLWPSNVQRWRFATNWKYPNDLWQWDCDGVRKEIP